MMPRWLLWVAAGGAVGAVVWWGFDFGADPIQVKVVVVERGRVESTIANTKAGTVRARQRAQISSEIGGRVATIHRREGDSVVAGAPIIELDGATQRAQLNLVTETLRASQAGQQEACIRRDRARRELERKRELATKRVISDDVLDSLASGYDAANASCRRAIAEVGRARAQIAAAEVEVHKLVIRAPFDGLIAEVSVEVGEWVTPSPPLLRSPSVVDVISPTSHYVSAPMDEVDSGRVRVGQSVVVTVDSHPDREFAGTVVRVAPYVIDVEAQNRTVEIEVELDDPSLAPTLLPGTSADVEVVLEVRHRVLRIPTQSLLESDRVLVPNGGRLAERSVEIGLRNWDYAEVTSGLEEGEWVVLSLDRVEVEPGARADVEEIDYRP